MMSYYHRSGEVHSLDVVEIDLCLALNKMCVTIGSVDSGTLALEPLHR